MTQRNSLFRTVSPLSEKKRAGLRGETSIACQGRKYLVVLKGESETYPVEVRSHGANGAHDRIPHGIISLLGKGVNSKPGYGMTKESRHSIITLPSKLNATKETRPYRFP